MKEFESGIKITKFIMIEADVLLNDYLSNTDKVVYGLISALSNRSSECRASTKYLTKILHMSDRQLRRCLENLRKYNYIDVKIENGNKRVITTRISSFIEERSKDNNNKNLIDYNWLED